MDNPDLEPATGDGCTHDCVPLKEEPDPELVPTNGDGGAGHDCKSNIGIDTDSYCSYIPPKDEPESKFIDIYYHPVKEEPEPELGGDDGNPVDIDGSYDCNPPKEEAEPELATTGNDVVADSGRDSGNCCSYCGISLSTPEFKVKHELRCKGKMQRREFESQITEVYYCGYCRCPFVSKELKERHQQKYCRKRPVATRRDSNGTYFECESCEYVTQRKDTLAVHLLKHSKNNAEWFTCTQCSYKTVHKRSMSMHMKIHGNAFSCCCPICGKSFRMKRGLDEHLLKQHFDEWDEVSKLITSKIYTCNICDRYRTTVKGAFNEHVTVTHLKGVGCQKYECPRCPYSTFLKKHLDRHSKTHAQQKDYQCVVCKKQFAQKQALDSHVLSYHSDNVDLVKTITSKIHRCELCSFKTVHLAHLTKHVRLKHI